MKKVAQGTSYDPELRNTDGGGRVQEGGRDKCFDAGRYFETGTRGNIRRKGGK